MLYMTGKSLFPDWERNKIWKFFWKIFFEKTSKMSHSAEKWKGGTLWDLLTYILLQNIKKLEGGLFWDLKKFSKKISHSAEKKIERGDPLVSSGFVGYVKKVKKNERGDPFALISADRTWPLMLVVLVVSIVRKVAQSEWDCSLTKKKRKKN